MPLVTVDSNVLIYCVDSADPRQRAANAILAVLVTSGGIITVQALGEFFHAARRKKKMVVSEAADQVRLWKTAFAVPVTATAQCLDIAIEAAASGRFQLWDAMLLATAGAAGCSALITEDMHPGATLAGVTVVPAFAGSDIAPEAAALLA